MLLVEKKKKENISEYIIFMYQTEDLIRAYDFELKEIYDYVINHFPLEDEGKNRIKAWYRKISNQMKKQGIQKKGHLKEVKDLINELSTLNLELLKSDQSYRRIFDQAKLHIFKKAGSNGKRFLPIQVCLDGIYGRILNRLKGKPVDQETNQGVAAFSDVVSYLSFKYQKRNNGH